MRLIFSLILFLTSSSLFAEEIREIKIVPKSESDFVRSVLPKKEGEEWLEEDLSLARKFLEATNRYDQISFQESDSGILRIRVYPKVYIEEFKWVEDEPYSSDSVLSRCVRRNEEVDLTEERINEISSCILEQVRGRGYLDARAFVYVEGQTLNVNLIQGDQYQVDSVEFEGHSAVSEAYLRWKLENEEAKPFQPFKIVEDVEYIRGLYLSRGFYQAQVYQPTIQINPQSLSVDIRWKIEEGMQTDFVFKGAYQSRAHIDELQERSEQIPEWFVDEIVEDIRSEVVAEGYLEAEVQTKIETPRDQYQRVTISVDRGPQYRLLSPDWIGLNDEDAVKNVYQKILRLRPGRYFNEEEFREIFKTDFYQRLIKEGYLNAKVRTLEFSIDPETYRVLPIIYMNEGPVIRIRTRHFEGINETIADLDSFSELQRLTDMGRVYDPISIDEVLQSLQQEMREVGYLDAEIDKKLEQKRRGNVVRIMFSRGPRYKIKEVLIRGLRRTKFHVIQRELLFEKGDFYDLETINDTTSQILRLGLARSVEISVFEKKPEDGVVYLVVDILEASRFRFEIGPGFGTVDGLRGVFRATYANIAGTGRRLNFYSKASRRLEGQRAPENVIGDDIETLPFIERRFTLEYFEPQIFNIPIDGRITLSHRKISRRQFSELVNSVSFSADWRINRYFDYSPEYKIEYTNPFNVTEASETVAVDDTGATRLHSLGQEIRFHWLDDNFTPTEGLRGLVKYEIFDTKLGGNLNFWLLNVKQTVFYPLTTFPGKKRPMGLAISANAGFSDAYASTPEVPVQKRFRVGGEDTVRGYPQDGIQPVDRNGDPLRNGGRSRFYFRSELNIPVFGGVDLLGFFDGGNIYRTNQDFDPTDLRYGVGSGIRFNTPVGPVKFGYAFVVQPRPNEDIGQIYFGVGPL